MQYTWDSSCAFDMAAVPKAVARQLKLADATKLRVLMWLCCVGGGEFDAVACAADCGGSPELCEEALEYWAQRGVVVLKEDAPAAKTAAVAVKAEPPVSAENDADSRADAASPKVAVLPPSRPSRTQVLEEKESNADFSVLLDSISAKLGKVLSPADMTTYLYLYKDIGLPAEVILLIIGYAVKNGKARLSYIEKTALNWSEKGLTTFEAADAYLCHLERCQTAWEQVSAACSLAIDRPTLAQKEAAYRWVFEWKMPDDVIKAAVEYSAAKTDGKFQASYVDRVVERLHTVGVTTAEQAKDELSAPKKATKKSSARMKTAKDRAPSFDLAEYEKLARRHRPMPKKQED